MTSPEKIRAAIRRAVNAKKNIADVASINHFLDINEKIDQATLDAHHLAAREIPPLVRAHADVPVEVDDFGAPVPQVETIEEVAVEQEPTLNAHQRRQMALMGEQEAVAAGEAARFFEPVPDTASPSGSLENFAPSDANGAAPSHDGATPDAAGPEIKRLTIQDARKRMVESQFRLRASVDRQSQARQRVARAISRWQAACGAVVSDAELRRQHLAHEAEQRRLRAEGRLPERAGRARPGPSVIDQIAAATAGASYGRGAGTFAFRRGGTDIATSPRRLDAMLAAKLPSER